MSFVEFKSIWRLFAILIAIFSLTVVSVSCKSPSSSKAPPPSGAEEGPDYGDDDDDYTGSGDATSRISIEPADGSSSTFTFRENETVQISFKVSGASSESDVIVGLAELPDGMTLSGSSLRPVVKWYSAKRGTHRVKFLLRDAKECESSGDSCSISSSDFGNISSKSYDTTSSSYIIEVGDTGGSTTTPTGNQTMINTILGGVTGGGTGGAGDLQQLLAGLGGGQLSSIMGVMNGGQMDINAIMGLMPSLSLTEDKNAVPKEVLEEIVRVYKLNH